MQLKPTVSIVIPSCNGLHHLKNCLPSLVRQEYQGKWEILVVDNASTDGTAAYLREQFPQIRVVANKINEGFAKANNQAASVAQGEYLALINNDMRAREDWLASLVDTCQKSGAVCVGGMILDWEGQNIDFAGAQLHCFGVAQQQGIEMSVQQLDGYAKMRPISFACGGNLLIRRDVFLEIGGFDEDYFAYAEDVDLGWRLWLCGYPVFLSPTAFTFHRRHSGSAFLDHSDRLYYNARNMLYTMYKNYSEENLNRFMSVGLLIKMQLGCNNVWKNGGAGGLAFENYFEIRAVRDFLLNIPLMRPKRQWIQSRRVWGDSMVLQYVDTSINPHFREMLHRDLDDMLEAGEQVGRMARERRRGDAPQNGTE
ncbi:MAG TPA: glycosyltransferase family 2 protein [Patescibacteria group bacterium]|nr:glycosyltransferase family 2 protein [Patescibacteria group bacterium]